MRLISLFALLFLLVACNEEKEFMTPKQGEIIIDANCDEYSLNGIVLGNTNVDISNNGNLLINSLDVEIKKIRKRSSVKVDGFKFHFDANLLYDEFYKLLATVGFSGVSEFRYVIGSDFKNVYTYKMPNRNSNDCRNSTGHFMRLFSNKNLSKDEILDWHVKEKARRIECSRKYIGLTLDIDNNKEKNTYTLSLNETGLTDGNRLYSFEKEDELWKYIEDIRLRRGLQEKEDRDNIMLVSRKSVQLKNIAPVIKKLTAYGYKVSFAITGF